MSFETRRCPACQVRWIQAHGLCRQCWRARARADQIARAEEASPARLRWARHVIAARERTERVTLSPLYSAVYDGQSFDVMWDGSR